MTHWSIVQNDFITLVQALAGFLAFFLCNDIKGRFADRNAWRFLSLFALTIGLYSLFNLIRHFSSYFPFLDSALPFFSFLGSSFAFGFAVNIRSYSGDFLRIRPFWYLPLILGFSGAAVNIETLAYSQLVFIGIPAIILCIKVFYRAEVFKVRKPCMCHRSVGLWLILLLIAIQLESIQILKLDTPKDALAATIPLVLFLLSLWSCSRREVVEDSSAAVKQNYRLLNFFLPGAMLLIIPVGLAVSIVLAQSAFQFEIQSKAALFTTVETLINGKFTQAKILVKQFASHPGLENFSEKNTQSFSTIVDQFAAIGPNTVVYLLNLEGTVIATSNRNTPESFIGKNFAFRPYFKSALKDEQGELIARGVVSNVFGYYCSLPVKDAAGKIVAVAVVKTSLEKVARFFPQSLALALVDDESVLVTTNRPRTFWVDLLPIEIQKLSRLVIDQSEQEGFSMFFSPMHGKNQQTIENFVWLHNLNHSDWSFIVVDSARFLIWARLLGMALTLTGIVIILAISGLWNLSLAAASETEKSSRVYQTLVEGSSNIVVLTDIYGNIQAINETGKNEFHFDETDNLKRLPEYWDEKSRDGVRQALQNALAGKKVICEAAKIEADGECSYWELILNPVIEDDSPPRQIIGIFHNFTERKLISQEINRQKNLVENVLNTAQAIILLLDMKGRVIRANPYFYELTGYKPDEVIGQNWLEKFIPEFDFERVSSYFRQYINNMGMTPMINKITAADGKMIDVEWKNRTIKGENGKSLGVISVGQDITHHLKMESSLRESKTRFAMLNNCFVRFTSSPQENINILTEAAWQLTAADTAFSKKIQDNKLLLLARASISEEMVSELPEECLIRSEIANAGREPQIIPDLQALSSLCPCLAPYESAVFCNFFSGEVLLGTVFCCFQDRKPEFSEEELDLFSIIAQAIGVEVERLNQKKSLQNAIEALAARNRRMSLEMDIARTVHQSFLPSFVPDLKEFDIGFKFKPCFSVGGDYFDFVNCPHIGRMGVLFADISGHGVAGALLSSMLKMILFTVTQDCPPASDVLKNMNDQIEENFPSGYFVSAFYALLDENTGLIELANAAPEPALVIRSDGKVEIIARGGQPMGLLPSEFTGENTFSSLPIDLKSGDKLVLFTDGLTDIKIAENERVGLDRICRWLAEYADCNAQNLCEKVYQNAVKDAIDKGIDDDIMILAISRR